MHPIHRAQPIIPHIRESYLDQHFPPAFMQNLPHDKVKVWCCIYCYMQMAQHQMFPPDRVTPRAICKSCWARLTAQVTIKCWVCGSVHDQQMLDYQRQAPQDIHYRIHEGKCMDYFALVSARALGVDTGVCEMPRNELAFPDDPIEQEKALRSLLGGVINEPQQITYEPQETIGDIINMVPRQKVRR